MSDQVIAGLNAILASGAGVANIWAATQSPNFRQRMLFGTIAMLAFMYSAAFTVLIFSENHDIVISMRAGALVIWPMVWAAPALEAVNHHRKERARAQRLYDIWVA